MTNKNLRLRPWDLLDTRSTVHLAVWGDLGTWVAVDDELKSLALEFESETDVESAIVRHAQKWGRDESEVRSEALPIVEDFVRRGVLFEKSTPLPRVEEPPSIANVTFNITNRCNLRCPFCYNDAKRATDEVDIDDAIRFLVDAKDILSSDSSLIILGGEPLLEPERLFALLRGVKGIFTRPPMISTNGTRLNDELVSRLAKERIEVQVSLDSADPKTHDTNRGRGVFHCATEGIRRLVNAPVYTILSMVIKKSTMDHMEGFLALASGLKVNEARFILLRNVGAASVGAANLRDLPDPLFGFEQLLSILEKHPEYANLLSRDFFSIAAVQCRHSASRVSCGIGRRVIFIDADGCLYPCPNHAAEEFRLGHVKTDSLADILLYSNAMSTVRTQYHIDRFTKCAGCPFRRWCAGDCRGEVLATFNDPTAPSPHCESLKEMYKQILWCLAVNDPRIAHITERMKEKDAANASPLF